MCSGDAPCSLRREYPRAFTGGASVMRHTLLHLTAKGSGIRPCRRWLPPVRVGLPNRRRWCHRGAPPQRPLSAECLACIAWVWVYPVIVTLSMLPECGLGCARVNGLLPAASPEA